MDTAKPFVDRWLDQYRVFWGTRLQQLKEHVEARSRVSPQRTPPEEDG